MQKQLGLPSILHLLAALVQPAQSLSRPPISKYPVAAVGLGSSGRIFLGVNLEFPGLPLHQSVHAEQFLLTNLSLYSEPSLLYLAVSAAPCGHCRQFFQEIRSGPDIRVLITSKSDPNLPLDSSFIPLSHLLPDRFGPPDLLPESASLFLEPIENGLSLVPEIQNGLHKSRDLISDALAAANKSHAPYSNCPSGVALLDRDGNVYRGSYTESAAFNPSFGPVQAALAAYVSSGGGGYDRITVAVLVEKKGAAVQQESVARLLVGLISPDCEFRVAHCS